jgi:hypothetical protein
MTNIKSETRTPEIRGKFESRKPKARFTTDFSEFADIMSGGLKLKVRQVAAFFRVSTFLRVSIFGFRIFEVGISLDVGAWSLELGVFPGLAARPRHL